MKTYSIHQAPNGDWEITDGIASHDGYPSRLAAAYAMRIACWGGGYPSPADAQDVVDAGWTE